MSHVSSSWRLALLVGAGLTAGTYAQSPGSESPALDRFDLSFGRQSRAPARSFALPPRSAVPPPAPGPPADGAFDATDDDRAPGAGELPSPNAWGEFPRDGDAPVEGGVLPTVGELPGRRPVVAAADAPSGSYKVANGEGMGHVAQALQRILVESGGYRVPEIWVPPTGGRVGIPHVVACFNHRDPRDWSVKVGEELFFPPLDKVWPMVQQIKLDRTCPDGVRAPQPEAPPPSPRLEPAEGLSDFESGGGYRVVAGRTYSHYGVAARRELAALMPADQVPLLYPPPERFGLLHLMACWNSGDSKNMILRAGQVLYVPVPLAIPEARAYLDEHEGQCPPDFRAAK